MLQGPHDRRVERLARLHAELEPLGADTADQILAPGEEPKARSLRAVFVEAGRADIDAELQRARLVEGRRADPCAASVVDIDERTLFMAKPDNGGDRVERHQVVSDGQPGQHDQRRPLGRDRVAEGCQAWRCR